MFAPLILVNLPPTYSVVLVAARAEPGLLVLPVKCQVLRMAPVVGLRAATLDTATPLIVLKVPVIKTLVPSGDVSTAATPPPAMTGRKLGRRAPVLLSQAARPLACTVVVPLVYDVNEPAT